MIPTTPLGELLASAARDIAAGARSADVVDMLVQNGLSPADAAAHVHALQRSRDRRRARAALICVFQLGLVALGIAWSLLTPIPDWRESVHGWVLALAVPIAALPALASAGSETVRLTSVGSGLVLGLLALGAALPHEGLGYRTRARDEGSLVHVEESCTLGPWDSAVECNWTHHRRMLGMFLGPELPDQSCACG